MLLLTDRPGLAAAWLQPGSLEKRYEVRLRPPLDEAGWARWRAGGLELGAAPTRPCGLLVRERTPTRADVEITLREGQHRQIRRTAERLGTEVVALHRVRFGPVGLGSLPKDAVRDAEPEELSALLADSSDEFHVT